LYSINTIRRPVFLYTKPAGPKRKLAVKWSGQKQDYTLFQDPPGAAQASGRGTWPQLIDQNRDKMKKDIPTIYTAYIEDIRGI
jgi:hypothetical protein